jgi:hypothetical protein
MEKRQQTDASVAPAADLLEHLEQVFGWSGECALESLGAYMMSTEAGQRLGCELGSRRRAPRAA